jgi:hypothetical protein
MVEAIELVSSDEIQSIAQEFFGGRQVGATVLGRLNGVELTAPELTV